jgi:hypothetical protein
MMKLKRCFESSPMKLAKIFCGASVGSMEIGEKPKSAADQRSALGENLVRRQNLVLSMLILILGWCLTAFTQEKPRPSNTDQGMTSEKAGQEVFRSFFRRLSWHGRQRQRPRRSGSQKAFSPRQ